MEILIKISQVIPYLPSMFVLFCCFFSLLISYVPLRCSESHCMQFATIIRDFLVKVGLKNPLLKGNECVQQVITYRSSTDENGSSNSVLVDEKVYFFDENKNLIKISAIICGRSFKQDTGP